MRNIYQLPDIKFCGERVALAVEVVPEVVLWDLTFLRPNGRWNVRSHLVNELRATFANGSEVTIDGVYLWKFRDSIPPEFGSDEVGYLDENPFTDGPVEALLTKLRLAHDLFFDLMQPSDTSDPPLSIHIDTRTQRVTTTRRYPIPTKVQHQLAARLGRYFKRIRPSCDAMIAETLHRMLVRGHFRFELEPDPKYKGMLCNVLKSDPWTADVYECSLRDMLNELDPKPDDPCGPTPTLEDRLRNWLAPHAVDWFKRFARRNDDLCFELRTALGWSRTGVVPPEELLRTLRDSLSPDLPETLLWLEFERYYVKMRVCDFVIYAGAANQPQIKPAIGGNA